MSQEIKVQPKDSTNEGIDMMDVAGSLLLIIIALVVWIFNKHVNNVGKIVDRFEKKFESTDKKVDYAHDRITDHIEKHHTK